MNAIPVGYLLTYNNRKKGTIDNWMSYHVCRNVVESVLEHNNDNEFLCNLINVYTIFDENDYLKLSDEL